MKTWRLFPDQSLMIYELVNCIANKEKHELFKHQAQPNGLYSEIKTSSASLTTTTATLTAFRNNDYKLSLKAFQDNPHSTSALYNWR